MLSIVLHHSPLCVPGQTLPIERRAPSSTRLTNLLSQTIPCLILVNAAITGSPVCLSELLCEFWGSSHLHCKKFNHRGISPASLFPCSMIRENKPPRTSHPYVVDRPVVLVVRENGTGCFQVGKMSPERVGRRKRVSGSHFCLYPP